MSISESRSVQSRSVQSSQSHLDEREQPLSIFDLSRDNYLKLPRLPIPELAESIKSMLLSCQVHDNGKAYQNLVDKAERFMSGQGRVLQAQLHALDQSSGYPFTYIQQTWDDLYLKSRLSHPINTSPFFLLNEDRVSDKKTAAQFVTHVVKWTDDLRQGQLSVKGGLCNSAMGKQFATAKIPRHERDLIVQSEESNNIILLCNGNILSLPVILDGDLISSESIEEAMDYVATLPVVKSAVSVLTAASRDIWASERERLIAYHPDNGALMKKIDEAIVILSIDTSDNSGIDHDGHQLLTGDIRSRWFDKHQIVWLKSADRVGMNFEHSCGDGTNWIQFIQDCMDNVDHERMANRPPLRLSSNELERIQFKIPSETKLVITQQEGLWNSRVNDVDSKALIYSRWGKQFAKHYGVSPDAIVQMAFQLAYFRVKEEMAPTYESAQMRQYFCGRTDTIRSCSLAAKAFVNEWKEHVGTKNSLLEAVRSHQNQTKSVLKAQGIDRHLLSLETLAEQQASVEPLFNDPLYKRSSTWLMSTSNASDANLDLFGFGPVTEEGFGLGYIIKDEQINVNITSFKSAGNCSMDLAKSLEKVLDDFYQLFSASSEGIMPDKIYP